MKTANYLFSEHTLFFFVDVVKAAMARSSIHMNFPGAGGACDMALAIKMISQKQL